MNNSDIMAIKEFRRFMNTYIYPESAFIIINSIQDVCSGNDISYEQLPQAIIKFRTEAISTDPNTTYSSNLHMIYTILRNVFIDYFNKPEVASFIKNKIHTEIQNEELKNMLRKVLQELQCGHSNYLSLLFNATILNDYQVYLYL